MRISLESRARLALTALAVATLAVPAAAAAKEPTKASIEGPGLRSAITLADEAGAPGAPLTRLAEQSGFAPGLFGHRDPDPMSRARPCGDLGPRYSVIYTVPGPDGGNASLRQDVYPYASPAPVTYMAPGQKFFRGITSHGGWFRASPRLRATLVSLGLPETAPRGGRQLSLPLAAFGGAGLAAVLATAALAVRWRARGAPAPVAR